MSLQSTYPVLLFDGHCNLCSQAVQWVLQRDQAGRYHFASLQSDVGRALVVKHGLDPDALDSMVLVTEDGAYTKSTAALKLSVGLGGKYALAKYLQVFPRGLRDLVYDFVARNRYRWFGKSEACWLPRPEWKARFLD